MAEDSIMAGVLKVYNAATSSWEDVINVAASQFTLVENQTPTGSINGTNKAFTLPTGFVASTLKVYKNGVRMKPGGNDYTATSTGFTMTTAPATGTVLLCDYALGDGTNVVGGNSLVSDEVPTGTVNGTNKVFTTARGYVGATLQVFINGVKQRRGADFVETTPSSGTFTMDEAPLTGDVIFVNYSYNLNPSSNADTVDGYNANATVTANTIPVLDANAKLPAQTVGNSSLNTTAGDLGGAWVDYTPTCTGWSGTPTTTGTCYTQIGKTVYYRFIVSGTSNANNFQLSLPVTAKNRGNFNFEGTLGLATDNGTNLTTACRLYIDPASDATKCSAQKDMVSAVWTTSGTKGGRGTLIYEAA